MFGFITQVRARPGRRDELIEVNRRMQEVTADEDGVLVYTFHTAVDDPDMFWYYDLYTDEAAWKAHCTTPEYERMIEQLPELAEVILAQRLDPFGPVKVGVPSR